MTSTVELPGDDDPIGNVPARTGIGDDPPAPNLRMRRGWAAARVSGWLVATLLLTFDHRDDLATHVPGDPGDSYLVLSLLQWGGDHALRGFVGFWDGPMFFDTPNTMAYSDTFLALAVPFKLIEVLTGSAVVAFNVLYVGAWVLCAEATFALARRLVGNVWIAWAAATAFTFSTIRITGSNHFQLMWAGLIPLTFLLLSRFRDAATTGRGAALAAAVLAQVLTSAYYGVILLVVIGTAMTVLSIRELVGHRSVTRLRGHIVFFVVVGLPMLYVQHQYSAATATSAGRPDYPAPFAVRPGDLRSPSPTSTYLHAIPFLDDRSSLRSPENHAYVGAFVVLGLVVLLVLAAVVPRDLAARLRASTIGWSVVIGAGALGLAIGFGRHEILGLQSPFYDIARELIPGVANMLAIGRLVVFTQLALVLLGALALSCLLDRMDRRRLAPIVALVVVGVVCFEALMDHPMIYVVRPEAGSVNAHLETVGDGSVALLPMAPTSAGILHPLTEAPRLVLGANDDLRSVNGYSGYVPSEYDETVAALNDFPAPRALDLISELGLGFLVIYTRGIEIPDSELDAAINGSGFAFWSTEEANRRIDSAPPDLVTSRYDGTDGIVLELDPGALDDR